MTTAVDSKEFSNISANTAAFYLQGGLYTVAAIGSFASGSVELQMLGPDQSTFLSVPAAYTAGAALKISTSNGMISGYLPPGTYRFTLTSATGVSCSVTGIPIS
jgi:hypothetical protein